jgi:VWFA-related protein
MLLTAALGLAQTAKAQKPEDLPSAPSAVLEQQNKPKPQPEPQTPPAQQQAPAHQQAPAPQAPATSPAQAAPTPAQDAGPNTAAVKSAQPATTPKAEGGSDAGSDVPESSEYVYRVGVDEVPVIFTVTDKHGKFIKDLNKNDFQVLDDGKPPKQVVSFSRQTNLPLRVGLLVDASNSIRTRFKFEQDAAIEFLNQIVRPSSDRAFVIGFDTTPELTADFTDDTEKLSRGVRMLRPGGGTALYDAIYYACRDKLMKAEQSGPVRHAIVLLSDGDDNQSRVTREEAIEMAQRAEVIIYAISTNSSGYKERGDRVLERIADATGGRAFFPFKVEDVANAFGEIQDELRSQYAIAYKPAAFMRDGRYHSIEILAQNHKTLRVRARKGYFAPKP